MFSDHHCIFLICNDDTDRCRFPTALCVALETIMASARDYSKEFFSTINKLAGKHSVHKLFSDFVSLSARAISNQLFLYNQKLEDEYLDIAKKYSGEELKGVSKLLAITYEALAECPSDFLGHCYMSLGLGSKNMDQYFTPYPVAQMMAAINDLGKLPNAGYFSILDPTAGSGVMLIAYSEKLKSQGFNLEEQLLCVGVDIDAVVAEMAYLQLSILNIPAQIYVGNSLSEEYSRVYHTPSYLTFARATKTPKSVDHSVIENVEAMVSETIVDSMSIDEPIIKMPKQIAKIDISQLALF